MKKIIAILCIFCLLFVITGCGTTIQNDEEAAEEISGVNEEISEITSDLQEINEGISEGSS